MADVFIYFNLAIQTAPSLKRQQLCSTPASIILHFDIIRLISSESNL